MKIEHSSMHLMSQDMIKEAIRAANKYGPIRSRHELLGVMQEEWHEVCQEIYRNGSDGDLRKELVQLGAMCLHASLYLKNPEPTSEPIPDPSAWCGYEKGMKLVFEGKHGWDADKQHAARYLRIGSIYTVDRSEVHSFSTEVYLVEFPDTSFNSVMFQPEKEKLK